MQEWIVRVSLEGPKGERFDICEPAEFGIRDHFHDTTPPSSVDMFGDMSTILRKLKNRSFRKDLLRSQASRMAAGLAERLEDKEGWHGEDRREKLEDWG